MTAQNQAVHKAIAEHVHEEFARQSYGWGDLVGLALIDAVFSIRAQYEVKDEFKGVRGRLRTLRSEHESKLLTLSGHSVYRRSQIERDHGQQQNWRAHQEQCRNRSSSETLGCLSGHAGSHFR